MSVAADHPTKSKKICSGLHCRNVFFSLQLVKELVTCLRRAPFTGRGGLKVLVERGSRPPYQKDARCKGVILTL